MRTDKTEPVLKIVGFRLVSLRVEFDDAWLDAEREAPDEYTPSAEGHWYVVDDEERRYRVELSLKLRPKKGTSARFKRIDAAVAGIFQLVPGLDEKTSASLLILNAPAILHGMIRGVVAQATGLCPGGPVLVPAVNYQELFRWHLDTTAKKLTAPAAQEDLSEAGQG